MRLIFAFLLVFGISAPAIAENARGSAASVPHTDRKGDHPEMRATMAAFARCLLNRAPKSVTPYLSAFPKSLPARKSGQALVDNNDCLFDGAMRMQDDVLRGALYEAAYQRDYAARPLPDFAKLPQINYVQGVTIDEATSPLIALRMMADCIVRAAPDASHALIVSDLAVEKAQLAPLLPHVGACIPQGKTISFSPTILRGLIAETLYRLSAAASGRPLGAVTITLSTKDRLNA